jgi:hypothetical protein
MANLYVTLPLSADPYYSFTVALEGNSYIVQLLFNERMQLYTISLFNADNTPVVQGEALVPEYPMFQDYALPNLTGHFLLTKKAEILSEPYKEFPDKINEYYNFFYVYVEED